MPAPPTPPPGFLSPSVVAMKFANRDSSAAAASWSRFSMGIGQNLIHAAYWLLETPPPIDGSPIFCLLLRCNHPPESALPLSDWSPGPPPPGVVGKLGNASGGAGSSRLPSPNASTTDGQACRHMTHGRGAVFRSS